MPLDSDIVVLRFEAGGWMAATTSTPKIYLIIELWYDLPDGAYDSDIYEVYGRGAIGAATFEDMAEMVCREKTVAFLRSRDFEGFARYVEPPENSKTAIKKWETELKPFGLNKNTEFKRDIKSYSDDELLAICEFFKLKFFVVKEVELFA